LLAGAQDVYFTPTHSMNKCLKTLPTSYINSGVVLFNLKNMRDFGADKLLIKELEKSNCNYVLFDQDLINIAFNGYIKHIPIKWNYFITFYSSVGRNNLESGFIHHYVGQKFWKDPEARKRWEKSSDGLKDYEKDYWRYVELGMQQESNNASNTH
jgi:lipopolysaccharide biosynthesis glycosyltransferase